MNYCYKLTPNNYLKTTKWLLKKHISYNNYFGGQGLYKTLIFLGFIFLAAPISLPKPIQKVDKNTQLAKKQIFKNKFEKAYELKTYKDFEKHFLEKFEKVSK